VIRAAVVGALATALGGPLVAQTAVAGRWSVRIDGELAHDRGDLRLTEQGGRLLLASDDTTWLTVDRLEVSDSAVRFRIAGRRLFVGQVQGEWLRGRLHDPDAPPVTLAARRVQPGTVHWPVRPRVRVSELLVGSGAATSRFSDEWRDRLVPRAALLAEHARLAARVGLRAATLPEIVRRAQPILTGDHPEGRRLATRMLERIGASPAADRQFRTLFHPDSAWRIDIHDAAWQIAAQRIGPGPLGAARMLADLKAAGVITDADTIGLRTAVYRLARQHDRVVASGATFHLPGTEQQLLGVRAVILAYADARRWWVDAVTWLMSHAWIEADDGPQSPIALTRRFWQDSTLVLPSLVPTDFGGMQAVPILSLGPLLPDLLTPANGVAAEWLATPHGPRDALDAWRQIGGSDRRLLPVVAGGETMLLSDPAQVVLSRLGGFVATEDRILIDPTIMPLFAVGTVVHEWQHLRFHAARMVGDPAPGWYRTGWGFRLNEGDPWLTEGAAEWATEAVFASSVERMPLFTFVEAEKRLALGADRPDDTHVLGYLLVRAVAVRVADAARTRALLVADLHQPERLAEAAGMAGPVSVRMNRPNTLMLIPELTFVYDEGVSSDPARRLLVDPIPEPD
jgi:hypothetical protein